MDDWSDGRADRWMDKQKEWTDRYKMDTSNKNGQILNYTFSNGYIL